MKGLFFGTKKIHTHLKQANYPLEEKMKKIITSLLISFGLMISLNLNAKDNSYELVNPPVSTQSPDKVEVLEFFWYGCPHCYQFEPYIEHWAKTKPDNVEFIKVPAVMNRQWEPHARAFYAAQLMGKEEEFSRALFKALHVERKRFFSLRQLAKFAKENIGVDHDEFMDTMASFSVETSIRRSKQLSSSYKLSGVPSVVVNGKYKTDAGKAGGYNPLIKTINQLIEKESK